ncbi:MAG: serine/threonine-protein kinase [Myxococcales bacterium]
MSLRDPYFYVSGLLDLHNLSDPAERRAIWRQSVAALARAAVEDGPAPLDALQPDVLVKGIRIALASGFVDDLDWLEPAAAGAALYELAAALPPGTEQRELGRRVLSRLIAGNADAFVAIATRMALGNAKGFGTGAARARISLIVELPIALGLADGPLALALASRRELAREWITTPSTGALPARRLAARLLERAAREASRRASQGDPNALRVFRTDAISQAWTRLLDDRESLVWRHVAVARGLLAPWVPELDAQIQGALSPTLSPTEWRRAAASIAAQVAVDPSGAMRTATANVVQSILDRDPGAAVAFAWGITRAAEAEPEAAATLLDLVIARAPQEVAEAIVELRQDFGLAPFAERASQLALEALAKVGGPTASDDGAASLAREIARDLDSKPQADTPVRELLSRALLVYAHGGARAAYAAAREVLEASKEALDTLEAVELEEQTEDPRTAPLARRTALAVLRDLDIGLLERDVLMNLLRLGPSGDAAKGHQETMDALRDRLAGWILGHEAAPSSTGVRTRHVGPLTEPTHPTLGLRRLRALLHLVDSDVVDTQEYAGRALLLRGRWLRTARALLERFEHGCPAILRRTILAALARTFDALIRVGACDVSDVLLVVARHVEDPSEFQTLAEATMNPDLVHVLSRYEDFVRACSPGAAVDHFPVSMRLSTSSFPPPEELSEDSRKLRALETLARDLAPEPSGRIEALRVVLNKLHGALHAIHGTPSLRSLATLGTSEPEAVASLEAALGSLAQLAVGARGRLDPDRAPLPSTALSKRRPLTLAISRILSGAEEALRDHVVSACLDEQLTAIPNSVARLVAHFVWGMVDLPVERASLDSAAVKTIEALPAWFPPRRTLGGFFVVRALGSGAVGSVFIVTRVEDRHDAEAERFALKVPEYSATAARSVSEAEFLKMFRDEASALMALPSHPNLARFVTFDVGARPKPILVMELVEGVTLERLTDSRALDVRKAVAILDDILAGLEAMHAVGLGHLDLKPSNVVLRGGKVGVLVDFGLSGRRVRPGCATGSYGAPEVWGAIPEDHQPTPPPVDLYAFGCVAYEVLTGKTLFLADSEMGQIALHITHDGFPDPVRDLAMRDEFAPLAELLFSTLRRDPRNRRSATEVRADLAKLAPALSRCRWPIA